jgi:hypothetical protein
MDLENEFRQAMADHVDEVQASRTLAHDARRRHHRTVRRRTAIGVTAAGVVVAVAVMPTYHAFRPQTVGAPGSGVPSTGQRSTGETQPSAPVGGPTSTSSANPVLPRHAGSPSRRTAGTSDLGSDVAKVLLRYLPPGIDQKKSCQTETVGTRETTTCRWTGSGGWVEVQMIHDNGFVDLSDLGFTTPMPTHVSVRGRPALRTDAPSTFSQVMWIEHGGLGVWVKVSPGLSGRLTRVADGVRIS